MKFTTGAPTKRLTVLAQDPTILDRDGLPLLTTVEVPAERLAPGPKGTRAHVVDYDASLDKLIAPRKTHIDQDVADLVLISKQTGKRLKSKKAYAALINDPHFHAQNVYAIVNSTLLEFERALGRRISWGFSSGAHQIKIAPHAFAEMNAFYSRQDEMLSFGYFPDDNDFVFSCLSFDIVAHETTHAILDGLRTEYMRPASIDQGAFHEGFADIVALLSAFKSKDLVDIVLGGQSASKTAAKSDFKPENLRQSVLVGLAEQFGAALGRQMMIDMRGDALRRSATLLPGYDYYNDPQWRSEVHDFGEVLVAPIINSFLEIWQRRGDPLDPVSSGRVDRARAIEEGCKAAAHLLRICIRALDYLPPINLTFPDFLCAILTADRETAPDDMRYGYREVLRQSFIDYGIIDDQGPQSGFWDPPDNGDALIYGFAGHAEMQWDRESVFRWLSENSKLLHLHDQAFTKIVSVRPVVRNGPDGFVLRETVVEYFQLLDIFAGELSALDLERPDDMPGNEYIRLTGGGTLIFNDYGKLKYHIGTSVAGPDQSARLQSLWSRGAFDKERSAERRFSQLHRDRAMSRKRRDEKENW